MMHSNRSTGSVKLYLLFPIRIALVLATLVGLALTQLGAQQETRASVSGKITDPQGASIAGATVILTQESSGIHTKVQTNKAGDWTIRFLNPGEYHFEVTAAGFKKLLYPRFLLTVADQKILDATMALGGAEESITVEATAPLIDLTSSASGTVVESIEISEMPSLSNSPTQLMGLTPGAVNGTPVGGAGVYLWSNGGLSGGSINGSGSGSLALNYTIDGAVDNTNTGNIAFEPPSDAVSQFRVITNAYDASIGRASAGVVNVDMKAGGTKFHGDLYENNFNNFLNARYYNTTKGTTGSNPPIHNNQYGGSFGGPVWLPHFYDGRKKNTYVFYTFAGIRNRQPASQGTMSLPTALERQGDFSQSYQVVSGTKYAATIYDPLTYSSTTGQRTAFANALIPSARVSNFSKAFFALMPLPDNAGDGANSDSNNYIKRELQDDKFAGQTLRVDQTWSNRQHSFATFRWNNWTELSYDPFGPTNILNGIYQHRNNKGMTLDHTITLTQSLIADLRFNVTRYVGESYSSSRDFVPTSSWGLSSTYLSQMMPASIPQIQGIASGYENGGYGTAQGGAFTGDNSYTFDASLTQTYRSHTLHYGAQQIIQQTGNATKGANAGVLNYGGSLFGGNSWTTQNPDASASSGTGITTAGFLLDLPQSGSIANPIANFWSQRYFGVFLQDDWRFNSKLTFNFGLRWDVELPPTERNNAYFSRFDPTAVNTPVSSYAASTYSTVYGGSSTGAQLIQSYGAAPGSFSAKGAIHYAGVNGTSRHVLDPVWSYFQPRIGFSYQLMQHMVIRGGAGRFVQGSFNTGNQLGFQQTTSATFTADNYHTINTTAANPFSSGIQSPIGNTLGTNTDIGSVTGYLDPKFGRVYTDQASASVQREWRSFLFEVGGTYNLTKGLDISDPLASDYNGYNVNLPSAAAYKAAFTPTFDSTGRPVDTLAGNVTVTNPFYGAPYVITSTGTSKTISAYQLIRPNPVVGDIWNRRPRGRAQYYGLEAKIEKRWSKGFSYIQSFTWSKRFSENTFIGRQAIAQKVQRRLDPSDQTLHMTISPVYELPVGRGKRYFGNTNRWMDLLVGGYEFSGVYTYLSGAPIKLPTNTAFFQGGDPGSGFTKSRTKQFDTSKFVAFPTKSTAASALSDTTKYPGWTNVTALPGAGWVPSSSSDSAKNGVYQDFATWNTYNRTTFGSVRNPPINDLSLGIRKAISLTNTVKFQIRMDTFNALNHPRFGSVNTDPSSSNFGALSGTVNLASQTQVNAPRQIQLGGKLTF